MGNQSSAAHKGLLQSPLYKEYCKERKRYKGAPDCRFYILFLNVP